MVDDPLVPPLAQFALSENEMAAVEHALSLDDPWDLDQEEMASVRTVLKELRDRIKDFHLERQHYLCCYCRDNLFAGGLFKIDREHIVPKSHCKPLTYTVSNLSVACKRCNMEIKKNKIGLFHNPATIKDTHLDKDSYKIIHPNFEVYENFISRTQLQDGTSVLVKFNKKKEDAKTEFTFEFFKLKDLEYNSFDAAQGLPHSTSTQAAIESSLVSIAQGDSAPLDALVRLIGQVAASENRSDQRAVTALSDLSDADMAAFIASVRDSIAKTAKDSHTAIGQAQALALPAPRSPAADE